METVWWSNNVCDNPSLNVANPSDMQLQEPVLIGNLPYSNPQVSFRIPSDFTYLVK